MNLNKSETATVLAALRCFQGRARTVQQRRQIFPEHFADAFPLDDGEIDALCECINCDNETPMQDSEGIDARSARQSQREQFGSNA